MLQPVQLFKIRGMKHGGPRQWFAWGPENGAPAKSPSPPPNRSPKFRAYGYPCEADLVQATSKNLDNHI